VLTLLRQRDHDLLTSEESDFIRQFFELPHQAQALVARMAARTRTILLQNSLRYPELVRLPQALTTLQQRGWLDTDPEVTMSELFAALPVSCLAVAFGLNAHRGLNKARMLEQARELYPDRLRLSRTHFRSGEPLYQFMHAGLCRRLCAQYFGNHHQDWSQYIVARREIRRYESVAFDSTSRPFQHRREIDTFHALQEFALALDANQSAVEVCALLPDASTTCEWLTLRHQQQAYRLAQRLEREGEFATAVTIYGSIRSAQAENRERVLARKLSGEPRRRSATPRRDVPHMELSLSEISDRKIEPRVAEELARMYPDSEVCFVENRLFKSLFGLLFWRALYAPVRGAFFHVFQSIPADLFSEHFCDNRRALLDWAFDILRAGGHHRLIRETLREKVGICNPWVSWRWLRPSMLEMALDCIPAHHLLCVFEWMLSDLSRNTTGFPDLIQFWPSEKRYRLLEVKLGGDRLQNNQQQFLQHAVMNDMPISVCYVTAPPRPRRFKAKRRVKQTPTSPSLGLFL
jgi:VRR-NUC domain